MEWKLAEQTIDNNSPLVADQQVLDNAQNLSGKGTVAVHGVSSRLSYDQQQTLLPTVSYWYLNLLQHLLGYIPPHQVYKQQSFFLHAQ